MEGSEPAMGSDVARRVHYAVLGAVEVLFDSVPVALGGPKQRAVVAVLVASAGRPVSVDVLLQAVYGEDASMSNKASLQTFVSNLRHVLGDVIVRRGDGYLLNCSAATIDAAQFEDAIRRATSDDDPDRVSGRFRAALSTWRGHPYADVEAHGFLDGEITRLTELRIAALEARIDADMRAGRHREIVAELDALTVEHPFRENLRVMHMLALYRSGRQAEALRAFGRTRVALLEGLGIDPSAELQMLEQQILEQDPSLIVAVGPTVQRRAVVVVDLDDQGWHDPAQRERAFARREHELTAAVEREGGMKLAPRGTAGYAIFNEPIQAVRAARALVDERTRVALDCGDLEFGDDDPFGPPVTRAVRLVAVAHLGQVLLSSAFHTALTAAGEAGWGAKSLGLFDIVGLDPGAHLYQLVGNGAREDFPDLLIDRLPPALPSGGERSVPGYELRALIGVGELGEVHRAYQPCVGREVAVRIFGPGMVGHPQFVRRFETASQRITRVEHPHVLPLLDYWREPNRAVMVSRLVSGGNLADRVPLAGLDIDDAVRIFETVASGVASAHRHGVVHGRIRPENVLFDHEGNAYIADLGVDEICTGVISFATTGYDAPERLGGILATPSSDIYSLAVLLHQMVSGSAPPPDGPLQFGVGALGVVLRRATDLDPAMRQQSVDEFVAEVRAALAVPADPSAVFVSTRNPYRGLKPFEQADAEDFHGRNRAVQEMVEILQLSRLLVVVGPSGIGKSSAVKAGLIPALGRGAVPGADTWLITEMVPGDSPFEQLASALARVATTAMFDVVGELASGARSLDETVRKHIPPNTELLVVIDQFEELFTQSVSDADRRAFLQMIVKFADGDDSCVRIVITLRADYFDRPLTHPGFGEAIHGRTVALGAMTAEELADAVRRPADAVGVTIEPGLVDRIAADAELQPGSLPLIQHTLAELFGRRQTNSITLTDYEDSGGLAGAVGREAEAIYLSLDDTAREATRRVFLRLVSVSEDREDTRRRVRRTELEQAGVTAEDLEDVLMEYGRHRLITFDRDPSSRAPTVEVAHEALLREWPRLAEWVEHARDDLLTRKRVETATRDWMHSGGDDSFLLRGGRLELLEAWVTASAFGLTHDEHSLLAASRNKVDRDHASRQRRRRRVVGLLVAGLVATTTAGAVALRQRDAAKNAGTLAEARRIGTQALLVPDHDQALLLAVEARHLHESVETSANLFAAIQSSPHAIDVIRVGDVQILDVAFTPDGKTLLASGQAGHFGVYAIDADTGQQRAFLAMSHRVVRTALSPDGRQAVATVGHLGVGRETFQLQPINPVTLVPTGPALSSPDNLPPGRLSFSRDGRFVAAVTDIDLEGSDPVSAEAIVWDLTRRGGPILQYKFDAKSRQREAIFMPDSETLLVAGADGTVVVDIATGQAIRRIEGAYAPLSLSPDGHTLAATLDPASASTIGLFDVTRGQRLPGTTMAGHSAQINRLAFSRDGTMLASGSDDRLVMVWDVATGERSAVLHGHAGAVQSLAFSPDGSTLVSGGDDQAAFVWDLRGEGALVRSLPPGASAAPVLVSAADEFQTNPGNTEVVFQSPTSFQFLKVATGALSDPFPPNKGSFEAYSPDGHRYVTVNDDTGELRVWNRDTGALLADRPGDNSANVLVAFTPDDRLVTIGTGADNNAHLDVLDAATLRPVGGKPVLLDGLQRLVAVTPDGHRAIVILSDRQPPPDTSVILVDLDQRRIVRTTTIDEFNAAQESARHNTVVPDGHTVALGGTTGDVIVVDAFTGAKRSVFPAQDGFVESLSFSPDQSALITTGQDGTIKLWDTASQQQLGTVQPLGANRVVRATFVASDLVLISYDSGQIYEWNPQPSAWEAHACRVAGRNLTRVEWTKLLPGHPYHVTCPQYPAGD